MRSHGLRQLVDDKSVASCQQTFGKLIVKTCYPQACYKLIVWNVFTIVDYSTGFGGKYGVQKDRVDKVNLRYKNGATGTL